MRILICAAFALHGTQVHARGVSAEGNATVAVALAVLLGIVLAVPVVERYVRQWLKRSYFANRNPQPVVDPDHQAQPVNKNCKPQQTGLTLASLLR